MNVLLKMHKKHSQRSQKSALQSKSHFKEAVYAEAAEDLKSAEAAEAAEAVEAMKRPASAEEGSEPPHQKKPATTNGGALKRPAAAEPSAPLPKKHSTGDGKIPLVEQMKRWGKADSQESEDRLTLSSTCVS